MRAIFTQFSLLVGILTMLNLNASTSTAMSSASWGIAVGCMVYLVLLLGDFSIHRLLDTPVNGLTSVRFREQPVEHDMFDDSWVMDDPSQSLESDASEKEQLAA
jgi:hypothetical protein